MSIESSALALVGVGVSLLSLGVSGTTLYFTWLRRGRLAMTKPNVVFFGYEAAGNRPTAKIFLRTLLYSSSTQGKMVERMFVKLLRQGKDQDREQVFGFWGHGWTTELSPGSGLYVGQTGVSSNHHFTLSMNQPAYDFTAPRLHVAADLAAGRGPGRFLADRALRIYPAFWCALGFSVILEFAALPFNFGSLRPSGTSFGILPYSVGEGLANLLLVVDQFEELFT